MLISKNSKIKDLDYVRLDFINKNDLLKSSRIKEKVNSNFSIKGKSFDATQFINNNMDDDESSTIFENFNSKFDIEIGHNLYKQK